MSESKKSSLVIDVPEHLEVNQIGSTYEQFIRACRDGLIKTVKQHARGFSAEVRNEGLVCAFNADCYKVVRFLLNIDIPDNLIQLLEVACEKGKIPMISLLHEYAGIGATKTALEAACTSGRLDVANWIVKHYGRSFIGHGFLRACENGNREIADRMLELGAFVHIARMQPANGEYQTKKIRGAIYMCRANGWIDLANSFTAKLNILTQPDEKLIGHTK